MQPAEATATAQAALTPSPTPAPRLGKVAFVRGGDIWTTNLDTGQEVRLTEGGDYTHPRWSPSGRWLAFFRGRALWVVDTDSGTPWRIAGHATGSSWSPVADRLASVTGDGGLWVSNPDGSQSQELISGPGVQGGGVGRVAWSPDGDWLAFEWTETEPEARPTSQGLRRIRADGTGLSEIASAYHPPQEDDTVALAAWSPDGTRLTFWQIPFNSPSLAADGVPLRTVPLNGGRPTVVAERVLPYPDFAAWSPTGDGLAIVAGGFRATWLDKTLVLATPDGQAITVLAPATDVALSPAWAPDGKRLAYVGAPTRPGALGGAGASALLADRRIWAIAADGSNRRQLASDPAFRDERPQWSADGESLLFLRLHGRPPDLRAGLWLMRADGSLLRPIAEDLSPLPDPFGFYGYVDWSDLFDWWTGPPEP